MGLSLGGCGPGEIPERNYAQHQGNVQNTGVYDSKAVMGTPTLRWKFKSGGAVNNTPAIDGKNVYFGSEDGKLYALDVAAYILAEGESSRMVRSLKYDKQLVLSVSSASFFSAISG